MRTRVAIYPGSFDPPTLAHQEIRRQALEVFDRVPVIMGKNDGKSKTAFPPANRCRMWMAMGVEPEDYRIGNSGECVVDWAQEFGASHVVRGIRGPEDLPAERAYRRFLMQASHGAVDVVYFMTPPDLADVSSSAVRQIFALRKKAALLGWVDSRILYLMFDPEATPL